MEIVLVLALVLIGSFSTTGGTSGSSSGGSKKETVVYHQPPQQQQQPVIIYQQAPPQPAPQPTYQQQQQPAPVYQQPAPQPVPAVQQKAKASNSSIRNFAVKSHSKIANDVQKGNGEHLNSLMLLMESEGIPKDESLPLIKRALRKSNGNAEIFGDEIENSL